jgi:hypothetical protein
MSIFGGNPGNAPFASGYSAGPHAGVDTDPDTHVASSAIDTRARNALTLGLLSLLLLALAGIPAIWVGREALTHINAADGALKGRWAAWTGIVLGIVSVVLTVAILTYFHQHPSPPRSGITHA